MLSLFKFKKLYYTKAYTCNGVTLSFDPLRTDPGSMFNVEN